MKFDYLQNETDPPYIESTSTHKNGWWLAIGIVACGSLIIGVKLFMSRSSTEPQADVPPASITEVALTSPQETTQVVEQPVLAGTYDQITRDPFQSKERRNAVKSAKRAVHQKPKPSAQQSVRRSGQPDLDLKAIVLGTRPKAFINDTFVSEGESFEITGSENVLCQVISIDEQVVKVKMGQKLRVLRLTSDGETENRSWRF